MKKNLIITILLILSLFCFSACHKEAEPTDPADEGLEYLEEETEDAESTPEATPEDTEGEYVDAIEEYRNVSGNSLPQIKGLDYKKAEVEAYDSDIFIEFKGDAETFRELKEAFIEMYGTPTYEDNKQVNWRIDTEDTFYEQILSLDGDDIFIDYYMPVI